jgi:3-oxoacyl-[acyl-carrier protein] reductase
MTLIVTGGGSGIGRATALRLAHRSTVIVADRNLSAAEEVADRIREHGGTAHPVEVDVTDRDSVASMVHRAVGSAGEIQMLFNNAGISLRGTSSSLALADWRRMLDVHVRGTFLVNQAVLRQLVSQGRGGVILNMSSDFAVAGMPGNVAYAAAKTAVYSMTKSLALEFAPHGIRVNALGPGPIDTPMLRAGRDPVQWEAAEEAFRHKVPMRRLGQPDEVAAVADFLLGSRSSYITGQLVQPNGGQLTW